MGTKQLYYVSLRKLPNEYGDVYVMAKFSTKHMFAYTAQKSVEPVFNLYTNYFNPNRLKISLLSNSQR